MFYIYIFHKLYRLNLVTKLSVLVSILPYKIDHPKPDMSNFILLMKGEGMKEREKEREKVESREKRAVRAEKKKR